MTSNRFLRHLVFGAMIIGCNGARSEVNKANPKETALSLGPHAYGTPLIIGGQNATHGQFPFQISLQRITYEDQWVHHCGGAIVDQLHVLTAAHCVRGIHQNNIRVIAGEFDFNEDEATEQIEYVASYIYHSGYDAFTMENDIAIITLENPLTFNDFVRPISLSIGYVEASGTGIASGFGQGPILQWVNLTVINRSDCGQMYSAVGPITQTMVCAGPPSSSQQGACFGDSGSPFICMDAQGRQNFCGLVSWGMQPCGTPNYPSVFTNVPFFLDWISSIIPTQDTPR